MITERKAIVILIFAFIFILAFNSFVFYKQMQKNQCYEYDLESSCNEAQICKKRCDLMQGEIISYRNQIVRDICICNVGGHYLDI